MVPVASIPAGAALEGVRVVRLREVAPPEGGLMRKALTVLGVVALILAITMPATASQLRRVFSSDIANDTIRSEDIHNESIRGVDLDASAKGMRGLEIETRVQDFGPNGIGGAWCEDADKVAISGGAELSSTDVANDVSVRSTWPYTADPNNDADRHGWKVQLNAPPSVDPGNVTVYAVCVRAK
jgi:hypothetical protein